MPIHERVTTGSSIITEGSRWRLETPARQSYRYRLAQLDDYSGLRRSKFCWNPPATLRLRARVSDSTIPGTWGFGFWNDPFSLALGLGGMTQIFPVLPNAAWFFFASPENSLSFHDGKPSSGFLAAAFKSPHKSPFILIPELALFPLLIFRSWAKRIRAKLSRIIGEDSFQLSVDVTDWIEYEINWKSDKVEFSVNRESVFVTNTSPTGPLGLVIWIDNQYASFKPSGEIKTGVLKSSTPAWMEIEELAIKHSE
jgi:hypothetical protein